MEKKTMNEQKICSQMNWVQNRPYVCSEQQSSFCLPAMDYLSLFFFSVQSATGKFVRMSTKNQLQLQNVGFF